MKNLFTAALACVISVSVWAGADKHYDRNQLPQLNEQIIAANTMFDYEKKLVPTSSIIPVQTQRVPNLKKQEKRMIKAQQDSYRPLVIDQQFYLVDGHHRLDALTEMGIPETRVIQIAADIEDIVEAFKELREDVYVEEYFMTDPTSMEEVVVVGTWANLQNAADKQFADDKIISVVDSDALGNFPDSTAADAIRRLSGVNVENDQGEGRYVTIRGMSSDLNSVAVNGASVVAPENGRSVIMDGLPTELLDNIVVSKTLTPDQDADSIGGRVEFNTKKPTDLDDRLFKVSVSSKFAEQTDYKHAPNFSVTYGDSITDNTAHIIGLTYSSREIESFNNETGYGWADGYMNDDWEMRWYDVQRERYGFSYDLSHVTADNNLLWMSLFYNEYDETETRFKNEYGKIKFSSALPNGVVSSRVRHDAETRQRHETRSIGALTAGYEFVVSGWDADVQGSYSWAEEDDSDNADITFRNYDKELGGEFRWDNPTMPNFTAYDTGLRSPENLEFDAFEMWSNVSKDSEISLSFNAEKETEYGLIKTGAKWRSREKNVDDYIIAYTWDRTMADFDTTTLDWPFHGQTFGNHMTTGQAYDLRNYTDQMEVDFSDSLSRDFVTEEDIWAVYAQNTMDVMGATVIFGARYEHTSMDSEAFDQDGNPTYADNSYGFFSPSVTVKYMITDNVQIRAAIWRALSRPGFAETAPKTSIDTYGAGQISGEIGNPDLQPYKANNFDFAVEYMGDNDLYASIGVFRKDIDNAIYPTFQRTGTFNGITFTDGVETWINADDSTINGLELAVQKSWDNGVYVAANMTFTDSESTFKFDSDTEFTTPFRKLADEAANMSVGYDKGDWDVRLAANYRSDYLDWFADEDGDITSLTSDNVRYVDNHVQLDLTVKYDITDNLTLRAQAVNINDRPEFYYWGNDRQLSQYDDFGVSYQLGFDYAL